MNTLNDNNQITNDEISNGSLNFLKTKKSLSKLKLKPITGKLNSK